MKKILLTFLTYFR